MQAQQAHEDFMNRLNGEDTVMIKITEVETLLRHRGEVRDTYFPDDVTVITSGVIHDDDLKELRWTQERNAVQAFGPDFHIPTDYPVYGNMDSESRVENIRNMMEGTEWMMKELVDTDIQILPLVKGYTPDERGICYDMIRRHQLQYCVYYGSQYFGGKMGNGIQKLDQDVRDVVSELTLEGLILIGLQSSNGLARMPPEVVAAAGQRWIYQSELRDSSINEAVEKYRQWRYSVNAELGGGQTTLGSFAADSNEVMIHG
ncbi:hypothetical protein C457_11176 [Haloferax prahovense DSM 18310]|uniref:Uncharacterized protein n=1 Tax=Haloferax prahovense (strain DSM 18310 / JCM 13924 / TL6) TaxID=1227461 RepID=M0GAM3_HALPT|nr:hypothetical protein C457_11176 [Haloferax prahovense DSM 18310]